jgi:hypothetical protein
VAAATSSAAPPACCLGSAAPPAVPSSNSRSMPRPTSTRPPSPCRAAGPSRGGPSRPTPCSATATSPSRSATKAAITPSRSRTTGSDSSGTPRRPWGRPFPPCEQERRQGEDDAAKSTGRYGGRVEARTIRTTARLNDYLDGADAGQVCRPERVVRRDGNETREVEYAITSAGPGWAGAGTLLACWRGHWGIENRQPDSCSSSHLCAAGSARYHSRGGPTGVGRIM